MNLFKHFHRKPFLSQFFLGILAIFALPEIQAQTVECEPTVINQSLAAYSVKECEQEQHIFFLSELNQEVPVLVQQAVVFTEFFAKSYYFDGNPNQPIRAGPMFS